MKISLSIFIKSKVNKETVKITQHDSGLRTYNDVYGHCQEWNNEFGNNKFYSDHYSTVRKYYKEHELYDYSKNNIKLEDHKLIGKKFKDDGVEKTIQSVHKQWHKGFYLVILYYTLTETKSKMLCTEVIDDKMYGRSHGTRMIENISCHDLTILENINDNKNMIFY